MINSATITLVILLSLSLAIPLFLVNFLLIIGKVSNDMETNNSEQNLFSTSLTTDLLGDGNLSSGVLLFFGLKQMIKEPWKYRNNLIIFALSLSLFMFSYYLYWRFL